MHGRIFWEFRDYAEARFGPGTWLTLLKNTGLEEKIYLKQTYPDTEIVLLANAACAVSGKPLADLLEEFGEFMVPSLMNMYGHLMQQQWRTLDVIEQTERTAHSAVRLAEPGTAPPFLRTKRLSSEELTLIYSSPRKMCALAIGVAKGLGKHFNEEVSALHVACMHRGARECEIAFQTRVAKPVRSKAHHF